MTVILTKELPVISKEEKFFLGRLEIHAVPMYNKLNYEKKESNLNSLLQTVQRVAELSHVDHLLEITLRATMICVKRKCCNKFKGFGTCLALINEMDPNYYSVSGTEGSIIN